MSEILRYPDRVKRVEERFRKVHVSGAGVNAVMRDVSEGWYIVFDSGMTLPCGEGKPEFVAGTPIRHTIEKV